MSKSLRWLALGVSFGLIAGCSDSSDSGSLSPRTDADADGLPDVLERRLGSDPLDPDAPFLEGADDDDTPDGPGRDALPDGLERYLLARGAETPILAASDSDGDGVPDYLEVLSDLDPFDFDVPLPGGSGDLANAGGPAFDGISDAFESYLLRRGAKAPMTASSDTDADGLSDALEARSGSDPFRAASPAYAGAFDLDEDGVPDWLELALGSDPLDADFPTFDGENDDEGGLYGPDGDGVTDGLEGWLVRHGAQAPVHTLTDSDADGLWDVAEVRAGSDPFDADNPLAAGGLDDDGDGLSNALEHVLRQKGAGSVSPRTDSDRDSVPDFAELGAGSDPFDASTPVLFGHFDLDHDGLVDFLELVAGSDALDPDSPLVGGALDRVDATGPGRDPISDGLEALMIARGSAAPVTTYSDSDGDGVTDLIEMHLISDPFDSDSPLANGELDDDDEGGPAGDGISDAAEFVLNGLGVGGPLDATRNSDTDVIPDAIELVIGSNPLDPKSPHPSRNPDIDADGVVDWLELVLEFDPRSPDVPLVDGELDSDADGLTDALEETLRLTSTPEPVTPLSDTDGDGLYDYLEVLFASDRADPDHPVVAGGLDVEDRTGPAGDGMSDALETFLVESGASRPVTTKSDTDDDEIPDYLEVRLALDAFDADSPVPNGANDSDGDRLSDALESVLVALGARPPIDSRTDTDGDGISDAFEVLIGTHPLRGDHPLADGGLDVIDSTGPRDSISDGLEALLIDLGASAPVTRANDTDGDGAPDHLEALALAHPAQLDDPIVGGDSDDDGDLLSAALEEVLVRLGGEAPIDSGSDTDRDGAPDRLEVLLAAHPLDASVPIRDGAGAGFDSDAGTGPNGDRISDAFELLLAQLGCPAPIGTASDADLDGLPDYFEVRVATDPLDADSPLAGGGVDTDDAGGPAGDGLSDALEALLIAHGATGPVTRTTDTDGDGVPDFYEVFKGSDPFDERDEIPPGTRPRALSLALDGVPLESRVFTGTYVYSDSELDPEGATTFRWLRNGTPIPGATGSTYTLTTADLGTTLIFEVTPVSAYAWPLDTEVGSAATVARAIPIPDFPRGNGGPGGIGTADGASDLRLWLRPDLGVERLGAEVTTWRDQSGYGRHAVTVRTTRRPDLVEGAGLLGAPAVRFDGNSHLSLPRPVEDNFTFVSVFATTSNASNSNWYQSPGILGGEVAGGCGDFHYGVNGGKPLFVAADTQITTGNTFHNGLPHEMIATRVLSTGRIRLYVDGPQRSSAVASPGLSINCPTTVYLGSATDAVGFWTGDLMEFAAFSEVLNDAQRTILSTYHAARYGTTPSEDIYAYATTHAGDVAGIGRVSDAARHEAAEGRGIVRISNANALSDGDYLVWGTDLPEDYSLSTDVPAAYDLRLKRTYAYTITDGGAGDGVGRVSVRFRVGGLFLSQDPADFALLLDDDGAFADAVAHPGTGLYEVTQDTIEFEGVDLSQHHYFSLVVRPL